MGRDFQPGQYYAAPHVPEQFQKELTEIGGTNIYGRPNLLLSWGMDKKWIRNGEWVPQYPCSYEVVQTRRMTKSGIEVIEDKLVWFGVPRYYIERWIPFEVYCPQGADYWEQSLRWRMEEGWSWLDGKLVRYKEPIDVMGPAPVEGIYRSILRIQDGDGNYVHPQQAMLDALKRAYFEMLHNEKSPAQQIRDDIADWEERRRKALDRLEERLTDSLKSTAHWITDPARKRKGGSGTRMVLLPGEKCNN